MYRKERSRCGLSFEALGRIFEPEELFAGCIRAVTGFLSGPLTN